MKKFEDENVKIKREITKLENMLEHLRKIKKDIEFSLESGTISSDEKEGLLKTLFFIKNEVAGSLKTADDLKMKIQDKEKEFESYI